MTLLSETAIMTVFFGKPLNEVNPLALRLGYHSKPEWLKGKYRLNDFPRWTTKCDHYLPIDKATGKDIVERIQWIVEELNNGWCITAEGFGFESDLELIHFKLRWS